MSISEHGTSNHPNLHITRVPGWGKYLKKKAKMFPDLMKTINSQIKDIKQYGGRNELQTLKETIEIGILE